MLRRCGGWKKRKAVNPKFQPKVSGADWPKARSGTPPLHCLTAHSSQPAPHDRLSILLPTLLGVRTLELEERQRMDGLKRGQKVGADAPMRPPKTTAQLAYSLGRPGLSMIELLARRSMSCQYVF